MTQHIIDHYKSKAFSDQEPQEYDSCNDGIVIFLEHGNTVAQLTIYDIDGEKVYAIDIFKPRDGLTASFDDFCSEAPCRKDYIDAAYLLFHDRHEALGLIDSLLQSNVADLES